VLVESNCEAVATVLPSYDGNGDSALGVGEREKKGEMMEMNECSSNVLGWLLDLFT
jgi:hypothetical protein